MALPVITNNAPSAGYISWTAFGMEFGGVGYAVSAGNTNKAFTYWSYNGGSPLVVSTDTMPTALANEDYFLFLNKLGIGMFVDSAQVIDGSTIVNGSIYAAAIAANQISAGHIVAGTIDASKIVADTITANQIAADAITTNELAAGAVIAENVQAGAITTDKLGVATVSDSLVANGSFEEFANSMPLGWTGSITAGTGLVDVVSGQSSSGAYAARMAPATTTSNSVLKQLPEKYIPVTAAAGRKWYVSMRGGTGTAGVTNGVYLKVNWYDAAKAFISAADVMTGNQAPSQSWTVYEGQVTPPSTARYMGVEVQYNSPNVVSTFYVDEVAAREVIVSAVIGDGQITTPKIVANAITANELAAGAVTAGHLTATAIDGKTITGATVQTAASGARVVMDSTGLRAYSSTGNNYFLADSAGLTMEGIVKVKGMTDFGTPEPLTAYVGNLQIGTNVNANEAGMHFKVDSAAASVKHARVTSNTGTNVRITPATTTGTTETYLDFSQATYDLRMSTSPAFPQIKLRTGVTAGNSDITIGGTTSGTLNTVNINGVDGVLVNSTRVDIGAWQTLTLQGTWAAYAGGGNYFGGLRIRRNGDDLQIQGMIKNTATATGTTIVNLPSGLVPTYTNIRPVVTSNATTSRQLGSIVVSVATPGTVGSITYDSGLTAPTFVSINESIPLT